MRTLVRGCIALVLVVVAGSDVARADVAPPAGYVDPCKDVTLDEGCRLCTIPEFKGPDCHKDAVRDGLVERCSGWSSRMYCPKEPGPGDPKLAVPPESPPVAPPSPPAQAAAPPARAEKEGPRASAASCSVDGDDDRGGLAGLVVLLVGLARWRSARR